MGKKIIGYKTVRTNMSSWHDPSYKYEVGKTFEVKKAWQDVGACGMGLHFCEDKSHVMSYTTNKSDYILLQVEANEDDVVGRDNSKTRVSKLKIVKVLEVHRATARNLKEAAKYVKSVASKFAKFNPKNKKALEEKATALLKAAPLLYAKKCLITSNVFEAHYFVNEFYLPQTERTNNYPDELYDLNLPRVEFPLGLVNDKVYIEDHILNAVYHYFVKAAPPYVGKPDKKEMATGKLWLDVLELGGVPIAVANGTLVIFAPLPDSKSSKRK